MIHKLDSIENFNYKAAESSFADSDRLLDFLHKENSKKEEYNNFVDLLFK